jgi:hypothetical protein
MSYQGRPSEAASIVPTQSVEALRVRSTEPLAHSRSQQQPTVTERPEKAYSNAGHSDSGSGVTPLTPGQATNYAEEKQPEQGWIVWGKQTLKEKMQTNWNNQYSGKKAYSMTGFFRFRSYWRPSRELDAEIGGHVVLADQDYGGVLKRDSMGKYKCTSPTPDRPRDYLQPDRDSWLSRR